MTQLSEHFTLAELTRSDTAVRLGIDNSPDIYAYARLGALAAGLEQVRALLGAPIHVSSGYRCPELNAAVRGAKRSAHIDGYAADFTAPGFGPPLEVVRAIKASDVKFDQVIEEGNWVHISFAPELRGQILTARFGPNGTTYSRGVA